MTSKRTCAELKLRFSGYWHAGSGRGSGHHLDAVCERDARDLPYFPGRQLKGVLRHAVRRAEAWKWLENLPLPDGPAKSHEELLFGSQSQAESRDATLPGLVSIGNAQLPEPEREWLAYEGNALLEEAKRNNSQPLLDQIAEKTLLRQQLFDELFSTAIDENGTARRYSLRGLEVCLPVMLEAMIEMAPSASDQSLRRQQQAWLAGTDPWAALRLALPLVDSLGAHRTRGLGDVELTLEVVKGV